MRRRLAIASSLLALAAAAPQSGGDEREAQLAELRDLGGLGLAARVLERFGERVEGDGALAKEGEAIAQ